jgi:hypothetical protein
MLSEKLTLQAIRNLLKQRERELLFIGFQNRTEKETAELDEIQALLAKL